MYVSVRLKATSSFDRPVLTEKEKEDEREFKRKRRRNARDMRAFVKLKPEAMHACMHAFRVDRGEHVVGERTNSSSDPGSRAACLQKASRERAIGGSSKSAFLFFVFDF